MLEQLRQDREDRAAKHSAAMIQEREEAEERKKKKLEEERKKKEEIAAQQRFVVLFRKIYSSFFTLFFLKAEHLHRFLTIFENCSSQARIQFRLPDGSSKVATFSPDDPFSVVLAFAGENIPNFASRGGGYTARLASIYPRRNFDPQVSRISPENETAQLSRLRLNFWNVILNIPRFEIL